MAERIITDRRRENLFLNTTTKECSKCGEIKLHSEFYGRPKFGSKLSYKCKTCKKLYNAARWVHNPPLRKSISALAAQKRRELPRKTKQELLERESNYRRSVKLEVINAYGGACACCGETEGGFLTIDHIKGDGNKERRVNGRRLTGDPFYRQLRRDGFPRSNYQLLCWNCNCAKAYYGKCPHVTKQQEIIGCINQFLCA